MDHGDQKRVRWWPLCVVLAGTAIGVVLVRVQLDADRQAANLRTAFVATIAGLLGLVWFVALSRIGARWRLAGLAVGLIAVVALLATFRIRGVTGDLVPILEWRFADAPPPAVEPARSLGGDAAPPPGLVDFPQFLGPARDGKLDGPELARDWTARPPEELWRRDVGEGWSGFAVAGRRAITHEQHGPLEAVVCYDVVSGDVLWVHRDEERYATTLGGVGPRATPTIDRERVFTQGATGVLNCLELSTGAVVWSKNIVDDNGATRPEWGVAGSPYVTDAWVVVFPGGPAGRSLVAYDKATGELAWGGGDDPAHYSSPFRATIAGVEQFLVFNARAVTAHDARGGAVLWSYGWKAGHPHVCQPVVVGGDRVFVSSGYGTGCKLLRIERDAAAGGGGLAAKQVWRSLGLKAKFTNVVASGGFVYGLDDGTLACVDLESGRQRWKSGRYGHGQVLLVGDLLLVTSESGELILVEPVPDEPRELTRFRVFDGKTWNPPALAGEYLLLRTDAEAACFRLPVAPR